jgi:DNA polymerase beta
MTDSKQTVIDHLDTMRQGDLIRGEKFSAIAYSKAIKALKNLPGPLTSVDQVKGIKGIGVKIRAKIVEIIATGELASATRTRNELDLKTYEALLKVHGIGPVKARELVKDHKISGIDHLRKNQQLLNDVQRLGLKYYEDILERIPRTEMVKHEKILLGNMAGVEGMRGTVVGSYRRGAENSGDIDVLLTLPPGPKSARAKAFHEYVQRLRDSGYMTEVLSEGDQKCLSIVRLNAKGKSRRLDLLLVSAEQFPYSLLYFTGSGDFNVAFRKHALKLGYTLNEHEMKPTGKIEDAAAVPEMKFEAEIFAFLGLKYKDPPQRLGAGSVQNLTEATKAKVSEVKKTRKSRKASPAVEVKAEDKPKAEVKPVVEAKPKAEVKPKAEKKAAAKKEKKAE